MGRNIADFGTYISELKCEQRSILHHRRKTFALSFLINIESYKNLVVDLLTKENKPLLYFLPYKTSQDHAEITFFCIRTAGGWNNNSSALQFKWNIRKMLYKNSVMSSKTANCQDLENTKNHRLRDQQENAEKDECSIGQGIFNLSYERTDPIHTEEVEKEEIHTLITPFFDLKDHEFSHYQKNNLYCIAGSAAYKFLQKFSCHFCEAIHSFK